MHKMHQLPRFGVIRSADASAAATFAEPQNPRHFGSLFKDPATYLVQFFCKHILNIVFYLEPKYEYFPMASFRGIDYVVVLKKNPVVAPL